MFLNIFNLTTTTTMNAIIKIKRDNDIVLIKYNNINKVYQQDLHIVVECNEQYEVNDKELVKNNNCSTTPYKHVYYDATIVSAYQ
jgi:uridylate kinase